MPIEYLQLYLPDPPVFISLGESIRIVLEKVVEPLGCDRLGTLEGQPERAVPEELREDAVRATKAEEYGIELVLGGGG